MAAQLYQLPIYWIGLAIFMLLCFAALFGYLVGRRRLQGSEETGNEISGVVVGGVLGILGLVLAFTYGFNLTRYETRRAAIITEANAAGTVFLRAELLPEEERRRLQEAILAYTRTRVFELQEMADIEAAVRASLEAQAVLWPLAMQLTQDRLTGAERTFLLGAMNELIDIHTVRLAVGTSRTPNSVLIFGLALALSAIFLTAYNAGKTPRAPVLLLGLYALVVAGLFSLILDFDQSSAGLIRVDNSSLAAAIADMERALASPG